MSALLGTSSSAWWNLHWSPLQPWGTDKMKLWKYARPGIKNNSEWSLEWRAKLSSFIIEMGRRENFMCNWLHYQGESINHWLNKKYCRPRPQKIFDWDKTYQPGRKIKKRRRRQGRTGCCQLSQNSSDPADCHPAWQPLSCSLHLLSLPDTALVTAANTQGKRLSSSCWQDLC